MQVQTLRGVGGDIVYCEEAAYMDPAVFYEVIVPLMEVQGTATICISTPAGTWNFYSELTELRDDRGDLVFNVIQVGMVCDRCKGTEREHECQHPTGDRPEWKPDDTFDKVKAIYGNRRTLLQREVMGQIADDMNQAFRTNDLKAFFTGPCHREPHGPVDVVYVAVDPNGGTSGEGGGTGSETAVVSFFYSGSNVVVSGVSGTGTYAMGRWWGWERAHACSCTGSGGSRAMYMLASCQQYWGTVMRDCPSSSGSMYGFT